MSEFSPLGMSHFLTTAITVALIIFLPHFFIDKSNESKNIALLMLKKNHINARVVQALFQINNPRSKSP